ncbi:hypothetical protein QBC45DRAFT_302081, partial [Copromyces sp. CBS 386.78]
MLIAKMLKLSQQLNKLSKPILVYLAALQDVPGNPLNFATTLATAATTTTSYYVSSTCTESPTAVCQIQIPTQFDQHKHHYGQQGGVTGPTPFPFAYGYSSSPSSELGSGSGLVVWWS